MILFIATAHTSVEDWNTFALTYGKPSRAHITQLKTQLRNPVKDSQSVIEFMQFMKSKDDELALMNASIDGEDLTIEVLHGLDDDYKDLAHAIQARDTAISFEELHEKILNNEAHLTARRDTQVTISSNAHPSALSAGPY